MHWRNGWAKGKLPEGITGAQTVGPLGPTPRSCAGCGAAIAFAGRGLGLRLAAAGGKRQLYCSLHLDIDARQTIKGQGLYRLWHRAAVRFTSSALRR